MDEILQLHFIKWKLYYFDSTSLRFISNGYSQYVNIGSGYASASNSQQATTCTNNVHVYTQSDAL